MRKSKTYFPTRDLFTGLNLPPAAALPALRIQAGGHDVTERMPLTLAELERQRPGAAKQAGG